MKFTIVIQNLGGTEKWQVPFDTFSITEVLNLGASGNVSFSDDHLRVISNFYGQDADFILQAGYRELYIYDEAENLIFGGYIGEPTSSCDSNGKLTRTVAVNSWLELLEARFTNDPRIETSKIFTQEYAKDILIALMTYTQGLPYGDLGFTIGSTPNDVKRDRKYTYDTIKEALKDMSGNEVINGIDVEITPAKVINTFYPKKGSIKTKLPLIHQVNIQSYSTRTLFINSMANEIYVFGEGQREDMAIEVVSSTNEVKENFFLLQRGLSEKDTKTSANLIAKGQKALALRQSPRKIPTVVVRYEAPLFTEYSLGDYMPVIIAKENINENYRLKQRTFNQEGQVTLSFSEEE